MSLTRKMFSSLAIVCLLCVSTVTDALGQQATQSLERAKVSTPMTSRELLSTLRQAHIDQYGSPPSLPRLAMAWAQVALENDRGHIMWNHNTGNIGPGKGNTWYQHSPRARYRSFETFAEGAKVYWQVVANCGSAFRLFDTGQPTLVAEYLKKCGYYESELDSYAKGLTLWFNHALKTLIPEEERERREKTKREREEREWTDYQLTHAFTSKCACSQP